ncbi:MAG: NADH-quinone oxidoreductase subunit C [Methanoregula sp.]|jgi:NADH:ubiquinone oxidoreductase subunit C|uniref:NADH-quinone oxidoreductase subunit C n=1 Tax=Methanoregula sp. TaxID=2052170 RepID=UPI0025D406BF|nr:NADH-quinone oxidoreductase subunit C [Methanoregula sp.]MCK9631562.1 NADH-quinone oxidoreductase subunit C [Methanoregula sp.]
MTRPVTVETIAERMKEFGTVEQVRKNRIRIRTVPDKIHDAITTAQAMLGFDRLITISTVDNGETLELLYHLIGSHRIIISLSLDLPRDKPVTPTVSDLLPPAGIYERQIHDLFGITFEGNPNMKKIILNEGWPENEYPLRKDWKPNAGVFYGGIKVERM